MAISTATVLNAYDFQKLSHRTVTISADEYEVWTCKVNCDFVTVNYATANDATITAATVIQNAKRTGETVTIIGCSFVSPGAVALAATPTVATIIGAGVPSSISSSVVTLPLTGEDMSTELTDGTVLSTATSIEPLVFQMTFYQKVAGE